MGGPLFRGLFSKHMHQTHGFHTVRDTENPDWLEANAPFKCTRSDAWLSPGYYFWEKDLERAHQWGRFAYIKGERAEGYVILRAELTLPKLLDLVGDREHQQQMQDFVKAMREEDPNWKSGREEPPLGTVIALLRRRASKTRPELFPYTAIRAQDHPKPYNYHFVWRQRQGQDNLIDLNPRIQICTFDKRAATLQSVRIVFPEQYV